MNTTHDDGPSIEIPRVAPLSGWLGLLGIALLLGAAAWLFLRHPLSGAVPAGLLGFAALWSFKGLMVLQPNEAAVMTLFGRYAGTVRRDGFFFVNPFYARKRLSLRARNFTTPTLKVNDLAGNPIEVAAVITWRVADTAQAAFDVEDFEGYTHVQSEMGLREVASGHHYDGQGHPREVTLRGSFDAVSRLLAETIQSHVAVAGVAVLEARLTHLAYAPEIAAVMLRRQQAEAVIAAREKMVEGALGMVKLAVERMGTDGIAELGQAERASLAQSLMTVLLSEAGAQPVLPVAGQG
jgi:regulator of protease activity HflC (stomatin/prohibitin superfamily)